MSNAEHNGWCDGRWRALTGIDLSLGHGRHDFFAKPDIVRGKVEDQGGSSTVVKSKRVADQRQKYHARLGRRTRWNRHQVSRHVRRPAPGIFIKEARYQARCRTRQHPLQNHTIQVVLPSRGSVGESTTHLGSCSTLVRKASNY